MISVPDTLTYTLLIIVFFIGLLLNVFSPSFNEFPVTITIRRTTLRLRATLSGVGSFINLAVAIYSLKIAVVSYNETKAASAQRPNFEIELKYRYFPYQDLTEEMMMDSLRSGKWYADANNNDYFPDGIIKDKSYRYDVDSTTGGLIQHSKIYSSQKFDSTPFSIKLSQARKGVDSLYFFYLSVTIRNIGDLTAEDLFVTVNPYHRGVSISGEGIQATEPMRESDGTIIYSMGTKHIPVLTIHKYTHEEVKLTLKIHFRKEDVLNDEVSLAVGVYDKKSSKMVSADSKFKVFQ